MKKRHVIIGILMVIIAWMVYFDITSYISFKNARINYEKTLKSYQKLQKELETLQNNLKELHLQVANRGDNISQTGSPTGR